MHLSVPNLLSLSRTASTTLLAVTLILTVSMVACSDSVGPFPSKDDSSASQSTPQASATGEEMFLVQDPPELLGGMEDMKYPKKAVEAGIEGRVIVRFVVDTKGNVTNPTVVLGEHETLNQAALDAVKAQEFTPGRQDGTPVAVQMLTPLTFQFNAGSYDGAEDASAVTTTSAQSLLFEKDGVQVVRVLMNEKGDLLLGSELIELSNLSDAVRQRIIKDVARVSFLFAEGAPTDRVHAAKTALSAVDLQKVFTRKVE